MGTKKRGVSGKTHTKEQLDAYANQHNPNNKAYRADEQNRISTKESSKKKKDNAHDIGILEGESYGWCDDWNR